jgi:uncharacterized protein YdaU (DUF1376 family)
VSDLPWFPCFARAWLDSDTIELLTLEQEAVYMRLLMCQWISKDGYLTANEATLARVSRLDGRWRKVGKPILDRCFVAKESGRYSNQKLRKLWEHAREKSKQAKRAAAARWEAES